MLHHISLVDLAIWIVIIAAVVAIKFVSSL